MIVDRLFAAAEIVLATAAPNAGFASSAQDGRLAWGAQDDAGPDQ